MGSPRVSGRASRSPPTVTAGPPAPVPPRPTDAAAAHTAERPPAGSLPAPEAPPLAIAAFDDGLLERLFACYEIPDYIANLGATHEFWWKSAIHLRS